MPAFSDWHTRQEPKATPLSLALLCFLLGLAWLAGHVTPHVQPETVTAPDLSTYCYAYGGLYNIDVYYKADNKTCWQDYNGQLLPVAYKEIINP